MADSNLRHGASDDQFNSVAEISQDSRIDYIYYVQFIWGLRSAIWKGALVGMVLGAVLLHIMRMSYTTTLVVEQPSSSANSLGGALSIGGGGGGLGSLAKSTLSHSLGGGSGDAFSGASSNDYQDFQTLLDSNRLSETLLKTQPDAMHYLFQGMWDPDAKRWNPPSLIGEAISNVKFIIFGVPVVNQIGPNVAMLRSMLQSKLKVDSDPLSGNLTLTYTAHDPNFAHDFLMTIYRETDLLVADNVRHRTEKRIAYLNRLLPTITQDDLRASLIQTLSGLEQQMVTVQADKYYSAVPVDLPIVPPGPDFIKILLVLAGSIFACAVVASILAVRQPRFFGTIRRWIGHDKQAAYQN